MIYFFLVICSIFALILLFDFLTRDYVNPYTFTIVFGKKGSGKSCSMQKDLIKAYKKGYVCYADSNTDLPFVNIIDCTKLNTYTEIFKSNSKNFIAIDEINILWDNRDFKSFPKLVQKFFREQRKYNCRIIAYSQTYDADKKLRDLADQLAIQTKIFRIFTFRRYYFKKPVILTTNEYRDNGCAGDDFKKVSIFNHGLDFTFIPKYVKKYDTREIHK